MIDVHDAIGFRLRSAREAAGFSLDDVAFQSQLPKKVLTALENEDFAVFTSPLYAKSFLSQYSAFLGVDADPWIDAIEPGEFIPTERIATILEGPVESVPTAPAAVGRRGGWLAVLGLLAVSVGVVLAAIKGYDAFEKRFGGEPSAASNPHAATPADPVALPSKVSPVAETTAGIPVPDPRQQVSNNPKTAAQSEEETLAQPPPRAIIVR